MPELLDRGALALPPVVAPDERAARRSLLDQIARLEADLAALFCSTYPRQGFEWDVSSRGGPRILSLQELEVLRDDLAQRLHDNRRRLGDRTWVEQQNRQRIEHMIEAPEKHKWVIVSNEDIGEPGCKHWHVRPRLGLIGMLMGWWRVKISSGCPSAGPREAAWDDGHVSGSTPSARRRLAPSATRSGGRPRARAAGPRGAATASLRRRGRLCRSRSW